MRYLILWFLSISVVHAAEPVKVTQIFKPKGPKEIWVMVIDTGLGQHALFQNYVQYAKTDDYVDEHGHGTHIVGIVLYGNKMVNKKTSVVDYSNVVCKNVRVIPCKYYDPKQSGSNNLKRSIACVNKATELKVDFINYSGGGTQFSAEEHDAYSNYLKTGGIAIVAAGNEHSDISESPYFPAMYGLKSYKIDTRVYDQIRLNVVQNMGPDGELLNSSNFHPLALKENGDQIYSTLPGNKYGSMTGTSQATAQVTHLMLKQRCKELSKK